MGILGASVGGGLLAGSPVVKTVEHSDGELLMLAVDSWHDEVGVFRPLHSWAWQNCSHVVRDAVRPSVLMRKLYPAAIIDGQKHPGSCKRTAQSYTQRHTQTL